jgi:hypothetical protein
MKRNTRRWLRGLIEAAIQAASTSIAVVIVEPHMATSAEWWKIPAIAGAAAFMAIVRKLQAEPLPPEDKPRARAGRIPTIGLLLIVAMAAGACAPRNVGPQLAAAEDAVHDALASAHDRVEAVCKPGQWVATCKTLNGTMAQVLRAGRAFSVSVASERLGSLSALVEEIGKALAVIRDLPESDTRERLLADLRRAIDGAFQGVQ